MDTNMTDRLPAYFTIEEMRQTKIPAGAFTVKTENSIYLLGEANEEGERTISREGEPLDCTLCRIIQLSAGKRMVLRCLDGPNPGLKTSPVYKIE